MFDLGKSKYREIFECILIHSDSWKIFMSSYVGVMFPEEQNTQNRINSYCTYKKVMYL